VFYFYKLIEINFLKVFEVFANIVSSIDLGISNFIRVLVFYCSDITNDPLHDS
jgi:hypothetical protein